MSDLTSQRSLSGKLGYALTLLLFVITYLLPLTNRALWMPDETRYAEISREMIQSGDWIVPKLLGLHYFEKPIAGYWLNSVSQLLFGENGFAVRFASALSAGACALALYWFAKRLFQCQRKAIASAVCYLSFLLVYSIGTYSVLDSMVTLWLNLTLIAFFTTLQAHRPRDKYLGYALVGVTAGLGFLTKGFISLAVPGIVALPYLLYRRQLSELRYLWITLLTLLAISLPWAIAVHLQAPDYWHYFFWIEHIQRFAGEDAQHSSPIWYYLPILLAGTLPWLGLLPRTIRHWWQQQDERPLGVFLLCWLLLPLLFFSIAKGKLPTYILICFAPLALLIGRTLIDLLQAQHWPVLRLNGWINLGFGLLLAIALYLLGTGFVGNVALYPADDRLALLLGCLIFIAWGLCGAITLWRPAKALWFSAASPLALGLFIGCALPDSVIYSKLPGPFVEQHQTQLADSYQVYANDTGLAVSLGWELKRQDINLLATTGELAYGLQTSGSPDRAPSVEQFVSQLPELRRHGKIAVVLRHDQGAVPTFLPAADETYTRERLTLMVYHPLSAQPATMAHPSE